MIGTTAYLIIGLVFAITMTVYIEQTSPPKSEEDRFIAALICLLGSIVWPIVGTAFIIMLIAKHTDDLIKYMKE